MVLPDLPERPTLRPGLHVVRRDAVTLQIGVDPPARVIAPDTDGVRRLIDDLSSARTPHDLTVEARTCLSDLLAADLVVPAGRRAAAAAQFGTAAEHRVRARAGASAAVRGPEELAARAADLLAGAGLVAPRDPEPPTTWLVLSEGEPVRDSLDELVRQGAPHLLVVSRVGRLEIGPFVAPGRTACLRCVDAHRAEPDPRRHLVVEQTARLVAAGAPEPRDDVLWSLATAWAVRDVLRFVEGERPSTWSASFEVGPTEAPRSREWARHPHCGCVWDQLLSY